MRSTFCHKVACIRYQNNAPRTLLALSNEIIGIEILLLALRAATTGAEVRRAAAQTARDFPSAPETPPPNGPQPEIPPPDVPKLAVPQLAVPKPQVPKPEVREREDQVPASLAAVHVKLAKLIHPDPPPGNPAHIPSTRQKLETACLFEPFGKSLMESIFEARAGPG